jgi:hypothetical protein
VVSRSTVTDLYSPLAGSGPISRATVAKSKPIPDRTSSTLHDDDTERDGRAEPSEGDAGDPPNDAGGM